MMISWSAAGLGKPILGSALGIAFGVCELPPDDAAARLRDLMPVACLNARVSEDIAIAPESGEGAFKIAAGNGAIGLHLTPMFSVQAKGSIRGVSRFKGAETGWSLLPHGIRKQRDHVVLRIGNPALHQFRASLGDQRVPFGVDANPADDLWQLAEDRMYWGDVVRSLVVSIDNMTDTQLDVGVVLDDLGADKVDGASARLMYDLSFFERARLVFSVAEGSGHRRYGFSFVSISKSGDTTHMEFARSNKSDPDLDAGFRKLFRFAFDSASRRWWLVYDEDRLRTQSLVSGFRYFFPVALPGQRDVMAVRFSVGRVRSFNSRIKSRTIAAIGLEASL